MVFKILSLVWIAAVCIVNCDMSLARKSKHKKFNCKPVTDGSSLHQQWKTEAHESCNHESRLMLPAVVELSAVQAKTIAASQCSQVAQCDPATDHTCAHCDQLPGQSFHNPACSWHYESNMDEFRYPKTLAMAVCNDNPAGCSVTKSYQCEAISYHIPVLYAVDKPYTEGDPCEYALKFQPLTVGCTCAKSVKSLVRKYCKKKGLRGKKTKQCCSLKRFKKIKLCLDDLKLSDNKSILKDGRRKKNDHFRDEHRNVSSSAHLIKSLDIKITRRYTRPSP